MRNKNSLTIADIYKSYVKKYNNDLLYSRFRKILEVFNNELLNSIFEDSDIVKLPYGLGRVGIVKYKPKTLTPKSLSVDYKSTKEYGKKIYHLNEHSDGYKYRLYWSKIPQTFPDRYKYQLSLVRANKRHLAQLIFKKHDYINIDDLQVYKM